MQKKLQRELEVELEGELKRGRAFKEYLEGKGGTGGAMLVYQDSGSRYHRSYSGWVDVLLEYEL